MVAEKEKEKKSAEDSSSQGQVPAEERKPQLPQREQPMTEESAKEPVNEEPEVRTPPTSVSEQDSTQPVSGSVNVPSAPSVEDYRLERLEPEKDEKGRLKVRVGDLTDGEAPLRVQVQNAALSDDLQELQKLTNWTPSQLQYFLDATKKGTHLTDIVRGMYPEPRLTPEQEKKKRRRENWQQAIAILGDLGIMAGDFIAAKGGGLVPKRTTTLSGEEGKRLEKLRQEHAAKMDKYRDMMIKAGMADAQTKNNNRMRAFELLTQATAEKRRQEQQQAIFDFQKQNAEQQGKREDRKIDISQAQMEQLQKNHQQEIGLKEKQIGLSREQVKQNYLKIMLAAGKGDVKKQPFLVNGKTYNVPKPFTDQFYDHLIQTVRESDLLKGSTDTEDQKIRDAWNTLSLGEKKNLAISLMKRHPQSMEKLILESPFVMENALSDQTTQQVEKEEEPDGYRYLMNMLYGDHYQAPSDTDGSMGSMERTGASPTDKAESAISLTDKKSPGYYGSFWEAPSPRNK